MNSDKRTFTLLKVFPLKGTPLKIKSKTVFKGTQPFQVAKKVLTSLCKRQKKGEAAYFITIQEVRKDDKIKQFTYRVERKKRETPLVRFKGTDKEFTINYVNTVNKASIPKQLKGGTKAARNLNTFRARAHRSNGSRPLSCAQKTKNIAKLARAVQKLNKKEPCAVKTLKTNETIANQNFNNLNKCYFCPNKKNCSKKYKCPMCK